MKWRAIACLLNIEKIFAETGGNKLGAIKSRHSKSVEAETVKCQFVRRARQNLEANQYREH